MVKLEYKTKKEVKKQKDIFNSLMFKTNRNLSNIVKFQYRLVGSSRRNLILYNPKRVDEWDLDYQVLIQKSKDYDPKYLYNLFSDEIRTLCIEYGFEVKDSTSALTIISKNKDIYFKCDVAILRLNKKINKWDILRFNDKGNRLYSFETLKDYKDHQSNLRYIKENYLWSEVRDLYKDNKEKYYNDKLKSFEIFILTCKEVVEKN